MFFIGSRMELAFIDQRFGVLQFSSIRSKAMKTFVSIVALAAAIAVTGPAFAQDAAKATDKASCDKAGATWDDAAKKCTPKM